MAKKGLPIIEIFGPTIAGEGSLAGQQTHFVRFGLCTYRCAWCDSMHAVLPEEVMKRARWLRSSEVIGEVMQLDSGREEITPWVSLSGGNPALHDLEWVVEGLQELGYRINVETQGDLLPGWLHDCDEVTVSPKPPSSGMAGKLDVGVLDDLMGMKQSLLKMVVFDEEDLEWVAEIANLYPHKRTYLSVGTQPDDTRERLGERYAWLADQVLARPDLARVSVLPQLHVIAWLHALEV